MGPYFADYKCNDAEITKHIIYNNQENMLNWLKPGDVLMVDREFRDALEHLQNFDFVTKMPHFLPHGQKQFTIAEANKTRLTMKIRWVVESANGRIKTWKIFGRVVPNAILKKVSDFVAIVCALINAYRPLFVADVTKDKVLGDNITVLVEETDKLQEYVEKLKDKTVKQLKWNHIDANDILNDFLKLTLSQLNDLTLGTYQIKQARNYTCEHLSKNGTFVAKNL
ncbi:unnamed protein product [Didymodactylos carnosus]|uniref:DDE Tnp4 domain-containing protein n=1 Tax=Didymodactylos carnosus TaxID=1234261 RepID=A0A814WG25_9BILA|nr:unnamed protein product [Didymodactylos carnosus]CAF1201782.1 unnamed protein product [Didymodactylos carnosus]CAF3797850.1 unnamed protein product [Didymodactylos carnosus]CAF3966245.1 unnamed protein product [Didymodactylos carnosus]